jgi:hypothetical protein
MIVVQTTLGKKIETLEYIMICTESYQIMGVRKGLYGRVTE